MMKKWLVWIVFLVLAVGLVISFRLKIFERVINAFNQSPNGKNWQNEVEKQKILYSKPKKVIFIGDSHIEQCEWQEVFPELKIGNRGIGGETSGALLSRLNSAILPGTEIVVVQIGVNDILSGIDPEVVADNYKHISDYFKKKNVNLLVTLPFVTRYYPEKNIIILELNSILSGFFTKAKIRYIDLNATLAPNDILLLEFSSDGVHLNSEGYLVWVDKLKAILDTK